jgi:heptosyltransferase-3
MKPELVVLSRCDRIGDLILSLPCLDFLARAGVQQRVLHCLPYCSDIAEWAKYNALCEEICIEGVDRVIDRSKVRSVGVALNHNAHSVDFFRKSKLSWTIGPRSKVSALWSYRKTLKQNRSQVKKSEMHYNLDLVRSMLSEQDILIPDFVGLPALKTPSHWSSPLQASSIVFVVSNRGSAENWPIDRYLELAYEELERGASVDFLVSGHDAEDRIQAIRAAEAEKRGLRIVRDFNRLSELIVYLSSADKVVSSSTGPIHLANALGKNILGIYPTNRVQSFERWRPDGYWHSGELRLVEI